MGKQLPPFGQRAPTMRVEITNLMKLYQRAAKAFVNRPAETHLAE
jgi:hypothetical protein